VELLAPVDDPDTRLCVTAERALLSALEAGCSAPVGALAEVVEGEDGLELSLRAFIGAVDGSFDLRRSLVGPVDAPSASVAGTPGHPGDASVAAAEELGRRLAAVLLEDGAPALARSLPPDPARATGDDPLAAPDRRPDLDSTERAL
jgi:hydroxymethylbilane synthase